MGSDGWWVFDHALFGLLGFFLLFVPHLPLAPVITLDVKAPTTHSPDGGDRTVGGMSSGGERPAPEQTPRRFP